MIPILYPSGTTTFTSNGLGKLSDCSSCLVTEERNGVFEVEFTYPVTGIHYSDIQEGCIICVSHDEQKDRQPFIIYGHSKPIDGLVTFRAYHISYLLSNIIVEPFDAVSMASAFVKLKTESINNNPFTFWTDNTTAGTYTLETPKTVRATLGGERGSLLDIFGGEYEFDNFTVRNYAHRGADNGVTIRYSKNLTDLTEDVDAMDIYDSAVGFYLNEETLVYTGIVVGTGQTGGTVRVIDFSSEYQEAPTVADLTSKTQSYLDSNKPWIPNQNISVNFVNLWQTEEYKNIAPLERVQLCDIVTIIYTALGVQAEAKVIKVVWNALLDRYDEIELGDAKSNFADTVLSEVNDTLGNIIDNIPTMSNVQGAIDHATQLITGGLGGHVVIVQDANGQPTEILIMDTADTSTAVNVLRINVNGIGFSHTGVNGTYTTAWTLDGNFVADFITSGTISANLISGGTLKIGGGDGTEFGTRGAIYVYDNQDRLFLTLTYQGFSLSTEEQGSIGYGNINIKNTLIPVSTYDSYNDYPSRTRNIFGVEHTKNDGNTLIQNVFGVYKATDQVSLTGHFYPIDYKRFWLRETDEIYTSNGYGNIKNASRFPTKEYMIPVGSNPTKTIIHREATGTRWTYQIDDTYNRKTAYLSLGFYRGEPQLSVSSGFSQSASDYLFNFFTGHEPAYASTSSKRFKCEIAALQDEKLDPKNLLKLEVKQFKYKDEHPTQYPDMKGLLMPGFIAEDVAEIYPSATIHDKDGKVESWDERRIIPGMLALIQEQHKTIQNLENRIKKLENLLTDDGR